MIEKMPPASSSLPQVKVNQAEGTQPINKQATEQQDKRQQELSKEKVEKVIHSMNDFLKEANTHLKFEFHDDLKEYYVTVVDDTTNEVVKEIPSKRLLDMYAAMTDYLGLLVDRTV